MVVTTSTNGTRATTPLKRSGRMLTTAPMSRPPALPPAAKTFFGSAYFCPMQELGGVDEVGEGVLLLEQLAVLVPVAAELLPAADVGDGVDEAAVEQRDRRAESNAGSLLEPYEP